MAELQNANPTIINLSELPTRRRQRWAAQHDNVELNAFSPRPPHWDQPSLDILGGYGDGSDHDSTDSGDPIDEQEIFGTHVVTFFHLDVLWFEVDVFP